LWISEVKKPEPLLFELVEGLERSDVLKTSTAMREVFSCVWCQWNFHVKTSGVAYRQEIVVVHHVNLRTSEDAKKRQD